MAIKLFSDEYKLIKLNLSSQVYAGSLKQHVDDAKGVLGDDGPQITFAAKIDALRTALGDKEAERTLQCAGVADGATATDATMLKTSTIKFLSHFYLMGRRGSQNVWVFSSPKAFSNYPSDELKGTGGDYTKLSQKLTDRDEFFPLRDRKRLSDATQTAMAWTQAALLILSLAKANPNGDARTKVKFWFDDGSADNAALKLLSSKLLSGFKKVAATLGSNMLMFTDMATIRSATSGTAKDLYGSEAFVAAGRHEKIPVVYIESAFFKSGGNVLSGPKNWARIIVHELTHLDVSTKDEKYAWAGIKPGSGITAAQAAVNADTWAYFAADCGKALSASDIERAMKGI